MVDGWVLLKWVAHQGLRKKKDNPDYPIEVFCCFEKKKGDIGTRELHDMGLVERVWSLKRSGYLHWLIYNEYLIYLRLLQQKVL